MKSTPSVKSIPSERILTVNDIVMRKYIRNGHHTAKSWESLKITHPITMKFFINRK